MTCANRAADAADGACGLPRPGTAAPAQYPIFWAPGLSGTIDERPVQHVDVAPSVLDLLGLPPHPSFRGRSAFSESVRRDKGLSMVTHSTRCWYSSFRRRRPRCSGTAGAAPPGSSRLRCSPLPWPPRPLASGALSPSCSRPRCRGRSPSRYASCSGRSRPGSLDRPDGTPQPYSPSRHPACCRQGPRSENEEGPFARSRDGQETDPARHGRLSGSADVYPTPDTATKPLDFFKYRFAPANQLLQIVGWHFRQPKEGLGFNGSPTARGGSPRRRTRSRTGALPRPTRS